MKVAFLVLAVAASLVAAACGGSDLGALEQRVAQLEMTVQNQQEEIDAIRRDTTVVRDLEQRVDGLSETFDDLKAKVEEVTSWIERVGSLFGG